MKQLRLLLLSIALMVVCSGASNAQTQDAANIRQQLADIAIWEAPDLAEYVSRAHKVNKLLPMLEAFLRNAATDIKHRKYKYKQRPDLMKLANFVQALNERDLFGVQLLKQEIRYAIQMEALAPESWQPFFDSQIAPLRQVEKNIAEEEVQMATDAINNGMPLPEDIVNGLKARQHP
jgi:hypothetical protein